MNTKTLNKRLVLNRETIVNLSKTAMGGMFGGYNDTDVAHSCPLNTCSYCLLSFHFSECEC